MDDPEFDRARRAEPDRRKAVNGDHHRAKPQGDALVLSKGRALIAEHQPQQGDAFQINLHVLAAFRVFSDIEIGADRFSFHR